MHRELNNAFHIALSRRARVLTAHKHSLYLKGDFRSAATPANLIQFSSRNYRVDLFHTYPDRYPRSSQGEH